MVREKAAVRPGSRVLVLGAAGSVGAFAVQIARLAGAEVVATAAASDEAYVRGLGAARVFDYRTGIDAASCDPVDAVIDTVGGEAQRSALPLVKSGGIVVSSVSPPDESLTEQHGIRGIWFIVDIEAPLLGQLARMFDDGKLTACVGTQLALAEARVAHEMLAGTRAHARGKIVLRT